MKNINAISIRKEDNDGQVTITTKVLMHIQQSIK